MIEPGLPYPLADIGAAVRAARERAGETQQQAAERASAVEFETAAGTKLSGRVSKAHVSRAESGDRSNLRALRALVEVYLTSDDGQPLRLGDQVFFTLERT